MKIFSECTVCRHWSSKNKTFKGDDYCTIHFPKETDRVEGTRRNKAFQKFLEFFRSIKDSAPDTEENV